MDFFNIFCYRCADMAILFHQFISRENNVYTSPKHEQAVIYLGIDTVRNLAIMSNAGALRQILANLLKNAAEALDSGGKVWIRTEYLQRSR